MLTTGHASAESKTRGGRSRGEHRRTLVAGASAALGAGRNALEAGAWGGSLHTLPISPPGHSCGEWESGKDSRNDPGLPSPCVQVGRRRPAAFPGAPGLTRVGKKLSL